MARFEKDVYDARAEGQLEADMAEGKALGVTGTPAFFINGRYLSGAKPFDEFAQAINAELKRLQPARARGRRQARRLAAARRLRPRFTANKKRPAGREVHGRRGTSTGAGRYDVTAT